MFIRNTHRPTNSAATALTHSSISLSTQTAHFGPSDLDLGKPCDTSGLDANEAFAKKHGFGGTPVIVRPSDGAVIEGYRSASDLRKFLNVNPKRSGA
jgi:hypothetical protein